MADVRPGVLIVEDNAADRNLIADIVSEIQDARIRYADTVEKAMGLLKVEPIDLAILDLGLAKTGGKETVYVWLAEDTWHGPVIVATGSENRDDRLACESRGWPYIQKDDQDYRQQLRRAVKAALSLEDTATGSKRQREALAESMSRMEKRQQEMVLKIDSLVSSIDEMKRQRMGYWTKDDRGRDVWVEGCFTICQRAQELIEGGKAVGGQVALKLALAAAGAIGGGVITGLVWLLKMHGS